MAIDWLNVGWLMWLIDWILDRFDFDWLIDNQECILIIDHETGELTLERLSHQVNIHFTFLILALDFLSAILNIKLRCAMTCFAIIL